jgi:gas vesicle protein
MEEEKKKRSGLLTGIIVGGAVGSVLSLLFSTEKQRQQVKKVSHQVLEGGKSFAERFLEKYRK